MSNLFSVLLKISAAAFRWRLRKRDADQRVIIFGGLEGVPMVALI